VPGQIQAETDHQHMDQNDRKWPEGTSALKHVYWFAKQP